MRRLVSLALNQPLFMMLLTALFIGAGVLMSVHRHRKLVQT